MKETYISLLTNPSGSSASLTASRIHDFFSLKTALLWATPGNKTQLSPLSKPKLSKTLASQISKLCPLDSSLSTYSLDHSVSFAMSDVFLSYLALPQVPSSSPGL